MDIATFLQRLTFILIGGMVFIAFKLMNGFFSLIGQSIEHKKAQMDSDKVFGKLNQEIEIYDPNKDSPDAD